MSWPNHLLQQAGHLAVAGTPTPVHPGWLAEQTAEAELNQYLYRITKA